jgi:methyl-accepting chemotaxis protein
VKLSLSQRIIVPSSAVFVLLQLGLGACILDHERHSLLHQLDTQAKRLATSAERPTQPGETLLERDDVVFCEVRTGEGEILFRGGVANNEQSRHYSFPMALERGPSEDAGTLSLALSTLEVDRAVTEARGMIIVAIMANTALAAFFVTLIVRRVIGNSVTRLLKEARIASAGYIHQQTTAPRACDEFEQLTHALRAMSTRLRETVDKQSQLAAQAAPIPTPLERVASE